MIDAEAGQHNPESPAQAEEKRLSNFERKIALIGIGLAAITAALFYVQLNEMTKQTQILATQSESANAGAMMDEMNTRKQLAIAQQQVEAAGRQANAAQHSVKAIQNEMEVSERPWIAISDAKIASPISIDREGHASTNLNFNISNTGKTPAIGIIIAKGPLQFTNRIPYQILKQACSVDNRGDKTYGPRGDNLFPGQPPLNITYSVQGKAVRIVDITTVSQTMTTTKVKEPVYSLPLYIVGCAIYRPSFSKKPYHTGFIYDTWAKTTTYSEIQFGGVPISPEVFLVSNGNKFDIPASEVNIIPHPGGGIIVK